MCEIRDVGNKWPQWHTELFLVKVVDMSVVCPQDVKKMLQKQARVENWKKWAAKHECEEFERTSVAGANPSCAAIEDQRSVDRQTRGCDEEACCGRSAEKTVRHWRLVR